MNLSINDPKVRHAQFIADKRQESMALMRNLFGGVDIKPMRAVNLMNADILDVVEPKKQREFDSL